MSFIMFVIHKLKFDMFFLDVFISHPTDGRECSVYLESVGFSDSAVACDTRFGCMSINGRTYDCPSRGMLMLVVNRDTCVVEVRKVTS